jgi:hypothetical protein
MSDVQAGKNRVAIQAATGQTYGEAGKQIAAQQAVPMGGAPTDVAQTATPRPVPGTLGALTRATERPSEPITAGAPFGAGPSPFAAGIPMPTSANASAMAEIRAIAQLYGTDDLLDLLDAYGNDVERS